jgi:protein involved in polysaccharide export with SLBB domain
MRSPTRPSAASLWVVSLLSLAECSHVNPAPTSASALPAAADASHPASSLGPGDVFEVRVFQEPDLSGIYRVGSEGTIDFPLCGKVVIAGLQGSGVSERLTTCLSAGFLKNPQVSIYIKEYNSKKIFVLGEVQKPGTFQYDDNMTIVQAITLAGGFSPRADRNNASVARLEDGREQRFKVPVVDIGQGRAANFSLRPGDIVFVPESLF